MVQAISGKTSAYKSLPAKMTKEVNVNKAYKKAKRNLCISMMLFGTSSIAATTSFLVNQPGLGAFWMYACAIWMLLNDKINKKNQKTIDTLGDAYKEILERANARKNG